MDSQRPQLKAYRLVHKVKLPLNSADMIQVLTFLEMCHCPILHIPGNHDAICQFENKKLTSKSIGIHKEHYQLAEGLAVFGFGGSVPAYKTTGELVW